MLDRSEDLCCPQCLAMGKIQFALSPLGVSEAWCLGCGYALPIHGGIPDFASHIPLVDPRLRPIQKLNNSRLFARFYETALWRGFLTLMGSGLSMEEEVEQVLLASGLSSAERVADLACGTGHYARALAKRYPDARLYGLDISLGMLSQAVGLARNQGLDRIRFLRGDIFHLPFADQSLDLVNCCGALHLFTGLDPIWAEISRVLRPGGAFTGWVLIALHRGWERGFQKRMMQRGEATFFHPDRMADDLARHGLRGFRSMKRHLWLIFGVRKA